MEDKIDVDNKNDDVLLPGFRFHPTDEELVGFYLKRKIQQKSLPIELIKQVDIYKYDPWDLPKLASTGEKEWYFYCPRDRKYRNSTRPNRVTGAGFWKATGTDRPIYSSDGTKCIGLKKSLVFYRGRAAKGIKTDWMMHEFRLPSIGEPSPSKKFLDKSLPPNDAWAICRIFKKTNSMAQRALTHSWISTLPETADSQILNHFSSENMSCTTEAGSTYQICSNNDLHRSSMATFPALDWPPYKQISPGIYKPSEFPLPNPDNIPNNLIFSPLEISAGTSNCTVDHTPIFLNPSDNIDFDNSQHQFNGFSMQDNMCGGITPENVNDPQKNGSSVHDGNQIDAIKFPFSLAPNISDVQWDSPNTPSEISTTYSTNKCYT